MNKEEIKQIRKRTGLNTEKFGELIGVRKKTVESWEQGVRNPSLPAITIIKQIAVKYEHINKQRNTCDPGML